MLNLVFFLAAAMLLAAPLQGTVSRLTISPLSSVGDNNASFQRVLGKTPPFGGYYGLSWPEGLLHQPSPWAISGRGICGMSPSACRILSDSPFLEPAWFLGGSMAMQSHVSHVHPVHVKFRKVIKDLLLVQTSHTSDKLSDTRTCHHSLLVLQTMATFGMSGAEQAAAEVLSFDASVLGDMNLVVQNFSESPMLTLHIYREDYASKVQLPSSDKIIEAIRTALGAGAANALDVSIQKRDDKCCVLDFKPRDGARDDEWRSTRLRLQLLRLKDAKGLDAVKNPKGEFASLKDFSGRVLTIQDIPEFPSRPTIQFTEAETGFAYAIRKLAGEFHATPFIERSGKKMSVYFRFRTPETAAAMMAAHLSPITFDNAKYYLNSCGGALERHLIVVGMENIQFAADHSWPTDWAKDIKLRAAATQAAMNAIGQVKLPPESVIVTEKALVNDSPDAVYMATVTFTQKASRDAVANRVLNGQKVGFFPGAKGFYVLRHEFYETNKANFWRGHQTNKRISEKERRGELLAQRTVHGEWPQGAAETLVRLGEHAGGDGLAVSSANPATAEPPTHNASAATPSRGAGSVRKARTEPMDTSGTATAN